METGISDKELIQIREQMLKFATLQVSNPVLAEDLVQESFLSAFNNLEHFKRQAAFKTWVFAILKNKIIDFLRQKGKFVLETEIEVEEHLTLVFDEGGHWKAEHPPLDLELSESAVYSEEDLYRIAASVEQNANHPLAKAIVLAAQEKSLEIPTALSVHSEAGQGISAHIDRIGLVKVGKPAYCELILPVLSISSLIASAPPFS